MKQYLKIALILFAICAVAAALLAVVNAVTAPQIAANALKETSAALMDISGGYDLGEKREGDGNVNYVITLVENKDIKGYVLELTSNGYGGPITLVASYKTDGELIGAKMMANSETPGLGKKSEESWYMAQFVGFGAANPIPTSKNDLADPSLVSGATVTFTGVSGALKNGSEYVKSLGGK